MPFTERFKYDVYYVDHLTFGLDLKIIFLTIVKVFKREGISAQGQATVERLMGGIEGGCKREDVRWKREKYAFFIFLSFIFCLKLNFSYICRK